MENVKLRITNGLLDNGTSWHQIVVTPADDVALEKAAKHNGWGSIDDSALTAQAFLSWHATKRRGLHDLKFEEFTAAAIYAEMAIESLDPTQLVKRPTSSPFGLTEPFTGSPSPSPSDQA